MNSFGRVFRITIFGESHGPGVGVVLDGCPAGVPLAPEDFAADLARRQARGVKGTTPRKEQDVPHLLSGVFERNTTGAPLTIFFPNENVRSRDYDKLRYTPRPGHADLVALQKFGGFHDHRGGGHFSGRLTAPLVAAGVVAKRVIHPVEVCASLLEVGGRTDIENAVDEALRAGDSLGGLVECRATGLPAGLGEPFFDSAESLLSHLIFAIPAIKAVEFGEGMAASRAKGSEFHDDIVDTSGTTATNNAGGIHGGVTNGNPLVLRVAVKPTSSIRSPKQTIDLRTGEQTELSVQGRHDACIALRVPVVLEAAVAIVVADLLSVAQKMPRVWRTK